MIALLVLILVAIVLVVVVALCAAGTIPVNAGIGLRVPSTRKNEASWEAGHRAAYRPALVTASATIVICAIGLVKLDVSDIATAIATGALVLGMLLSALMAHRAAEVVAN